MGSAIEFDSSRPTVAQTNPSFFFVHFVRSAAEFTIPNQGDQNNLDIWEVVKYTTFFRNVPYGPAGTI